MTCKTIVVVLVLIVFVSVSLGAQTPVSEPEIWRTLAQTLEPNAFVRVRLTDGSSVKGYIVGVADAELRVQPRTRIAVPLRRVAFADIRSIERLREPNMNPGAKVLLGVGIGVGTFFVVALVAAAAFAGSFT